MGKGQTTLLRLTIVDKYAILGMHEDGKTNKEIAKLIKKPVKLVDAYLEKILTAATSGEDKEKKDESLQAEGPRMNARQAMINKTPGGRKVTIMTEAAAQLGDESRKQVAKDQMGRGLKGAIHKPLGEEG